jgi:hypothetical protein
MNNSVRFFVAKYISDLQRMEPRNIGVIVCTPDGASARFVGEKPGCLGDVDGRSVPAFVTSTGAYKQWVHFWRRELDIFNSIPNRRVLRFVDNLRVTSHGNFCLFDGGMILDPVVRTDLPLVADDLFHRLVETDASEELPDLALDRVADGIIKQLRLTQNSHFHSRYLLSCSVAPNVNERFEFSHAYANGSLKRLYQRVPLARRRTHLRRTIHDSAWMFEKVVQQSIIGREQAIALVYATDEQTRDPEVGWSLGVLNSVARVANLAVSSEAMTAFLFD